MKRNGVFLYVGLVLFIVSTIGYILQHRYDSTIIELIRTGALGLSIICGLINTFLPPQKEL